MVFALVLINQGIFMIAILEKCKKKKIIKLKLQMALQ